jgi:prepilin-type N-terminal cleavage/methylation domain-containing protein
MIKIEFGNNIQKIKKNSSGFTVLEMLMVVTIVGIMGTVAIPGFMNLSPRMSLKDATRDIVNDMQIARTSALRDRQSWAIQFNPGDNGSYTVLSDDGADDIWNTADDTVYRTINLSNYIGISYGNSYGVRPDEPNPGATDGVSFNNDRIVFNSDGTSVSGSVYLNNTKGDTFAVGCLSAAGRIKTWHNYGSGWEE